MGDNPAVPVPVEPVMAGNVPTDTSSSPEAEPERCCHNTGSTGRNLIVCIDGTSNQFGKKNTNVIELYNLILKEDEDNNQHTWYNSGIGTYAKPSWKSWKFYRQVLYHKIDLAIAWDFERTVLAAYRWLSDNYKPGDRIFLFGFSRGAYQVRVLSAMIDKIGLIYKGNEMQIPFAYELYADPGSDKLLSSVTQVGLPQTRRKMTMVERFKSLFSSKDEEAELQPKTTMAQRFKSAFSHKDVKVHFVGAWDTVSSIGFARGKHMLPQTVDGMKHVCYFRHALALDERRVKFLPEHACGGTTIPSAKSDNRSKGKSVATTDGVLPGKHPLLDLSDPSPAGEKLGQPSHTLEVWFAGTHSDIGGGNAENVGMNRSRPPLRWMVFEAGTLGLRTALFERDLPRGAQIEIKESLKGIWWFLEILPFKRLTYTRQDNGKQTTRRPHFGSSRKIQDSQKIHSSLLLSGRLREGYIPYARPLNDDLSFWDTLDEHQCLELDLYKYTETIVEGFINGDITLLATLLQIAKSVDGRQAFYETVIAALKKTDLQHEAKHRLLQTAVNILGKIAQHDTHLKLERSIRIRPYVSDPQQRGENDYEEIAKQFMKQLTDPSLLFEGHTDWVLSVALSPDGRHLVSGSNDQTVRIWDAKTEKLIGEPFRGHTGSVRTVAFSPDGKRIVSGSEDMSGRIQDMETGRPVGQPCQGHTGSLVSVAFSHDSMRIVSGSTDQTIRIWKAETGEQVGEPFEGHSGHVTSVAFSPDSTRVVSGSTDRTVRIWDTETGRQVGESLRGHADCVTSVAFSPDGKRVVSGSYDQTVQIWDAATGKPDGGPLKGHTFWVISVAFLDCRRVISGSRDCTVRIWDAETEELVVKPSKGRQGSANSVAFSHDGSYAVLGLDDFTVQIWYAESVGSS